MRQFNLDLPFKAVKAEDKRNFPANKHITEVVLRTLVQLRYPQGMNGTEGDVWADIMETMVEVNSEDSKASTIEIEKSAVIFLLGIVNWCRENSKIPPLMSSWVRTLLDGLEEAKKQGEPKLESVKK